MYLHEGTNFQVNLQSDALLSVRQTEYWYFHSPSNTLPSAPDNIRTLCKVIFEFWPFHVRMKCWQCLFLQTTDMLKFFYAVLRHKHLLIITFHKYTLHRYTGTQVSLHHWTCFPFKSSEEEFDQEAFWYLQQSFIKGKSNLSQLQDTSAPFNIYTNRKQHFLIYFLDVFINNSC